MNLHIIGIIVVVIIIIIIIINVFVCKEWALLTLVFIIIYYE